MWLYEALEQNVDWSGWVMGDTPQTVMTTRAPAVLKKRNIDRAGLLLSEKLFEVKSDFFAGTTHTILLQ